MQTFSQRKYMIELRRRYITGEAKTLPQGYKQVEYIESNGLQYFSFLVNEAHDIEFEWMFMRIGEYFYLGSNNTSQEFYIWNAWDRPFSKAPINLSTGLVYKVKSIYDNVILYGEDDNYSATVNYKACKYILNAMQRSNGPMQYVGYNRYYYFTFFRKQTSDEILKLIPCYREEDGKVGMYDVIGKVFYTSESGFDFLAGPLQGA